MVCTKDYHVVYRRFRVNVLPSDCLRNHPEIDCRMPKTRLSFLWRLFFNIFIPIIHRRRFLRLATNDSFDLPFHFTLAYNGTKRTAPLDSPKAKKKWTDGGSNTGPSACKADVIPLNYAPNCDADYSFLVTLRHWCLVWIGISDFQNWSWSCFVSWIEKSRTQHAHAGLWVRTGLVIISVILPYRVTRQSIGHLFPCAAVELERCEIDRYSGLADISFV